MLGLVIDGDPVPRAVLGIGHGITIKVVRGQAVLIDVVLLDVGEQKEERASFPVWGGPGKKVPPA